MRGREIHIWVLKEIVKPYSEQGARQEAGNNSLPSRLRHEPTSGSSSTSHEDPVAEISRSRAGRPDYPRGVSVENSQRDHLPRNRAPSQADGDPLFDA